MPFILNDHPQLAAELEADGVHIGQDDGSLADARAIVGPGKIIGRSTHSLDQARALARIGQWPGFSLDRSQRAPPAALRCPVAVRAAGAAGWAVTV